MRRLEQGLVSRRPNRGGESGNPCGMAWPIARRMLRSRGLVATALPELRKRSGWRMLYSVAVQGLDGSDQGARELEWDGVRWEMKRP